MVIKVYEWHRESDRGGYVNGESETDDVKQGFSKYVAAIYISIYVICNYHQKKKIYLTAIHTILFFTRDIFISVERILIFQYFFTRIENLIWSLTKRNTIKKIYRIYPNNILSKFWHFHRSPFSQNSVFKNDTI